MMAKKKWVINYKRHIERLEEVIAPYLHPDFFFLNIGACDGVMGDPIYPFARKYHWRGIAVEPVPYNFDRLCRNFADEPQVILENAAISPEPMTFWYVEQGSNSLENHVSQIGSLSRDHLLRTISRLKIMVAGGPLKRDPSWLDDMPPVDMDELVDNDESVNIDPELESYVKGIDIPCFTISELLEKHNVLSVDYVNIDAEGQDYEVFKMIDFDIIRPPIICIEVSSFEDEVSSALEDDLAREGYEFARYFGLFSKVYVQPR